MNEIITTWMIAKRMFASTSTSSPAPKGKSKGKDSNSYGWQNGWQNSWQNKGYYQNGKSGKGGKAGKDKYSSGKGFPQKGMSKAYGKGKSKGFQQPWDVFQGY